MLPIFSLPDIYLPRDDMQHSPSTGSSFRQQFIPLLPDAHNNRARQHSAPSLSQSIWAPQPTSPGGTWPKGIFSYNESTSPADVQPSQAPESIMPLNENRQALTKDDVFGTLSGTSAPVPNRREVGAIGEGRQKDDQPQDADHVEKLLRTLDLNSPALAGQLSPCAADFDASPSTTSSFPPTPVENSPTTPCSSDAFFNQMYEYACPGNMGRPLSPRQGQLPPGLKIQDPYWNDIATFRGNFMNIQNMPQQHFSGRPQFDRISDGHSTPVLQNLYNGDHRRATTFDYNHQSVSDFSEWPQLSPPLNRTFSSANNNFEFSSITNNDSVGSGAFGSSLGSMHSRHQHQPLATEPINFLSLLHPSSSPPYALFVARIVKSSDQQASIFLQQKLKVADEKERAKIVDAICTKGTEMMSHRFGNWAVQRCLEAASSAEERRKIAACMRGHVVELATNCYGCHVLQKALDCEEDIRLLIVSELLLCDPAKTLINKHASHVWSKIMEISWTPPAPPIFTYVNKALQGKWASLACHETGSLVVQHAFENLEESAKEGIVDELLNRGSAVFAEVAKNQWGSYCIQHILEHGSEKHRDMALSHLLIGLLEFATSEQGFKSVTKALKEGGKEALDKFVNRLREAPPGGRRAIIVDLALSTTGSQFIASVLPNIDKIQRSSLYDAIRGHIVTLRGCKTGSKVIWLFDRMRAYYGS